MDFLRPYSKVPELNTASVLVVGAEGTGKHKLAKAMVRLHVDYSLQVRTAKSLPLPSELSATRPEIDFLVFMIDMANKCSLQTVESALAQVDPRFFIGKTCFAVIGANKTMGRIIQIDNVSQLVEFHNSAMICDELETDESCLNMARKILNLVETAAGFRTGVSPLLLQCTQRPYTMQLM